MTADNFAHEVAHPVCPNCHMNLARPAPPPHVHGWVAADCICGWRGMAVFCRHQIDDPPITAELRKRVARNE